MVGEEEVEVSAEAFIIAEAIGEVAGSLRAIANAINRLADATAGEELGENEDEVCYLDGKR